MSYILCEITTKIPSLGFPSDNETKEIFNALQNQPKTKFSLTKCKSSHFYIFITIVHFSDTFKKNFIICYTVNNPRISLVSAFW